jgi:hypothetical protein
MVHDTDFADEVFSSLFSKLSKLFKDSPNPESVEYGVKHIISIVGLNTNEETIEILMKILENLVSTQSINAR